MKLLTVVGSVTTCQVSSSRRRRRRCSLFALVDFLCWQREREKTSISISPKCTSCVCVCVSPATVTTIGGGGGGGGNAAAAAVVVVGFSNTSIKTHFQTELSRDRNRDHRSRDPRRGPQFTGKSIQEKWGKLLFFVFAKVTVDEEELKHWTTSTASTSVESCWSVLLVVMAGWLSV